MAKYNLTKVYLTKKGDVNSKTGKVAQVDRVSIKTAQTGEEYLSMMDPIQEVRAWQPDQVVEFEIVQSGEFKNFVPVTEIDRLKRRVKDLEDTLGIKLAALKSDICLELTGKFQTTSDYNKMSEPHPIEIKPTEVKVDDSGEINPADLPF